MDYSKFTDKELKYLKRKMQTKLWPSFFWLALGIVIECLIIHEIISFETMFLIVVCFGLSITNTFWVSFVKVMPIQKEQQRRRILEKINKSPYEKKETLDL